MSTAEDEIESHVSDDMQSEEAHEAFLESKIVKLPGAAGIIEPTDNDILCGRGKSVQHPGNLRFRKIIQERRDAYQKAKRRDEKTRITLQIVDMLRNSQEPARFLLKDQKTNLFYDVGDEYAKEKVSHALRARPSEEKKPRGRPKRNTPRKPFHKPELEPLIENLIKEQQQLLQSMIEKEVFPVRMSK